MGNMHIKCKLYIRMEDEHKTKLVNDSIKQDNERYIVSRVNGNSIEATASGDDVLSMLHTLDDFLSCLSLAMRVIDKANYKVKK